ncbi:dnaJ homolog subfamily C member 24-like [Topomyia yanbarensis]|uniref:dnaJ homolog subfamily C member 24-like n=1 Tax=Topomyia yanbarensis TaxID=2498891 RepID=UPI00273C79D6|nr:dnaJ homolog subfamily C member 24-like [Topomyia yanbarensis]XP_058832126.1 dnaJ homolog subfamily C member 24-like [Topomyia yanbarensis]
MSRSPQAESISQQASSTEMSHYQVLQVAPNASLEEIRKAYQSLALRLHPDKARHADDTIDEEGVIVDFVRIDEAWKVLRDVESRRVYDAELMQHTCREEYFVNEILTEKDFTYDPTEGYRYHTCRCGGLYILPEEELASEESCYLSCDECSLVVQVDVV